jgi:hypothetical protein
MPTHFLIKRGDTGRALTATLVGGNGAPQNLAGSVVTFRMRPEGQGSAPATVTRPVTVVDALKGKVRVNFTAPDTQHPPGVYDGEFVVAFGAEEITFPTAPSPDDFVKVRILHDVAPAP